MEALVLAGGFGTRLQQVVTDVPKPMASVQGKPFLDIVLRNLARKGFQRIVLSVGYKASAISSYFGKQFAGMTIAYAVENTPLGTGGAVRFGMSQCTNDHVFVFNGDTFLDLEVDAVKQLWQTHKRPIIVAREVEDASRYGKLLVENGQVIAFAEKGISGSGLINAGCYVLTKNQLDAWPLNKAFSLESDYFVQMVKKEYVDVFKTYGLFIDIGVPEDYLRAQTFLEHYT